MVRLARLFADFEALVDAQAPKPEPSGPETASPPDARAGQIAPPTEDG